MYGRIGTLLLAACAVAACDDGAGVEGAASIGVSFAAESSNLVPGLRASLAPGEIARAVTVPGLNGTLTIDDIYVIVSEFELEGDLAACDDDLADDCEEVESGPFLVQVPTDGSALQVATATVPLGSYTELEWEVEDLDFDEDEEETEVEEVRSQIEARFGADGWPAEASMVVIGSFLAADATTPEPFTTFFAAEIEVEMELDPPLELNEEGASRQLTIVLSPDRWFLNVDGTVMDLSALSGELVEFEAEFEDGVVKIERDDD